MPGGDRQRLPFNFVDEVVHNLDTDTEPWSIQLEVRVKGSPDEGRLRAAMSEALLRHPMARARKAPTGRAGENHYEWSLWERLIWSSMAAVEYGFRLGTPEGGLADRYLRMAVEQSPGLERYKSWVKAEIRRGDPSDIAAAGRGLSAFDAHDFSREVDVPTAVVVTAQDRLIRAERASWRTAGPSTRRSSARPGSTPAVRSWRPGCGSSSPTGRCSTPRP